MNAGFLRRGIAFVADFILIAGLVTFTFTFIARPVFVSRVDDFETLINQYDQLQSEKRERLVELNDKEFELRQVTGLSSDEKAKEIFSLEERLDRLELDRIDVVEDPSYTEDEREDLIVKINNEKQEIEQRLVFLKYSEEERDEALQAIDDARADLDYIYSSNNPEYADAYLAGDTYVGFSILYHIFAFSMFHIAYMLILKGHSLGRRLMKLRLSGNINVLSLLLREFFWKYVYWVLTLGIGLFIDMYMSILTTNKKTPRDYFSKTRVILEDIVYPF